MPVNTAERDVKMGRLRRQMSLILLFGLVLSGLTTCTKSANYDGARILAIGDSVLAWHSWTGGSIPDVIAAELGELVVNAAVSGARLSRANGGFGLLGADIGRQYRPGDWDWVIIDGGANDLRQECGCSRCEATLDGIISRDAARGEFPQLVDAAGGSGAQVMLVGYYGPSVRGGPFAPCWDELQILNARLSALAAARAGVHYVYSGAVMPPDRLDLYDPDLVHPSNAGAAAIGGLVAGAMRAAGP